MTDDHHKKNPTILELVQPMVDEDLKVLKDFLSSSPDARREPVDEPDIIAAEHIIASAHYKSKDWKDVYLVPVAQYRALADRLAELEAPLDTCKCGRSACEAIGDLLEDHTSVCPVWKDARIMQLEQRLAEVERERDKYKMEALVKFNCEVCSGALEQENANLHTQLTNAQETIERLKTMSTVEMMGENPNVDAHVREWETRCLKAEQQVERLEKGSDIAYRLHAQDDVRAFTLEQQVTRLREHLTITAKWMRHWFENEECDCDGIHTCARRERERELEDAEQALRETEA